MGYQGAKMLWFVLVQQQTTNCSHVPSCDSEAALHPDDSRASGQPAMLSTEVRNEKDAAFN